MNLPINDLRAAHGVPVFDVPTGPVTTVMMWRELPCRHSRLRKFWDRMLRRDHMEQPGHSEVIAYWDGEGTAQP